MATRGKNHESGTPLTEETASALLAMAEDTTDGESLSPALETLYAELGIDGDGEAQVHVSKLDADGRGTEAQVWRGDPDQYDLEIIAKKFGSGSYRVRVYVKIPTGQKVIKGNKVFAWMLSPEDESKRVPVVDTGARSTPQLTATDVVQIVSESLRGLLPQIVPQPQANPLEMFKEFAQVMKVIAPQPVMTQAQHDPLTMLKTFAEISSMMRGDSEPIERGANANSNDLLITLINKFGPMFGQVLAQSGGQMGAMPPVQEQAVPQLDMNPTQPAQSTTPSEDDVRLKMKMGLLFLIQQKEAGGAPETYAEVVLDSVPAEAVEQFMTMPNPVDYLAQFEPSIKNHTEWFNLLIAECKELLKPDEAETPETGIDKAQ